MTGWLLIHQRATRKGSIGSQSAPSVVDQARYGPVALAAWRCVRDRRAGCTAPPSDSHRCSAMGACGRSFALCMAIPSSWSGVDESLALAAVITTLYACVASVYGGTTSRVDLVEGLTVGTASHLSVGARRFRCWSSSAIIAPVYDGGDRPAGLGSGAGATRGRRCALGGPAAVSSHDLGSPAGALAARWDRLSPTAVR